jgi:hypothetical protein
MSSVEDFHSNLRTHAKCEDALKIVMDKFIINLIDNFNNIDSLNGQYIRFRLFPVTLIDHVAGIFFLISKLLQNG